MIGERAAVPTAAPPGGAVVAGARRRRRRREVVVVAALAGAALVVAAVNLSVGAYTIGLPDLVLTLLGYGDSAQAFVVWQLRAPRVVLGALTAVAFAVSGALFQLVLRNPLASPDVIGVSGGAGVAALTAVLLFGWSGVPVSLAAFVGALGVAVVIYLLSARGGLSGYRFVLIGVGVAFMVTAVLNFLLTRADVRDARDALVWLVGSLGSAGWGEIATMAAALAVVLPLTAVAAPRLRILQLGDDTARGLGVAPGATRLALLALAVALVAAGTAAVGPLAFVAFFCGPIARRLTATGGLGLVPTALVGVVIVTLSDFVAQHALGEVQVPVGVVTGVIGAPYLLWLLATANRPQRGIR